MNQSPQTEKQTGKCIVSKGAYVRAQGRRLYECLCAAIFFGMALFAASNIVLKWTHYHGAAKAFWVLFFLVQAVLMCCVMHSQIKKARAIDPGIPLTRANTADLPAPDSLVRASEEPVQEPQAVLLRAATESVERHEEQLVRASAGGAKETMEMLAAAGSIRFLSSRRSMTRKQAKMKNSFYAVRYFLPHWSMPVSKGYLRAHLDRWLFAILAAILFAGSAVAQSQAAPAEPPATLRAAFVTPEARQPAATENAVLFSDDFAEPADRSARYFEYDAEHGSFVWKAQEGMGAHRGAMRAQFEQGQVTAGALRVLFGKNPFGKGIRPQETFREIYWRVYVKHETGWQGNPAKLGRATCLATPDWSQGFIAHVWGGKGSALCIDPATGIQDSRKVTTKYNDFEHLHWLGSRQTQTPLFSPAESGRWVCIESHIRLNSPDRKDGVFELWIDGRLEAARTDLDWQGAWADYAINAVFLENYWNEGAGKREARWFSDFVISTRPIGPIVAASPPTFTRTEQNTARWEAQVAADAEGKDIVWTSVPLAGTLTALTIDAAHGTFAGTRVGQRSLAHGQTYWLRLRQVAGQPSASPTLSGWTVWHAPFRIARS